MRIFSAILIFLSVQDRVPALIQKSPVQIGADGSLYLHLKNNKTERVISERTKRYELNDGTIVYASLDKFTSVNNDVQVNFFDYCAIKFPKMVGTEITPLKENEVSLTLTSDYKVPTVIKIETKEGIIQKTIQEYEDVVLIVKKDSRTTDMILTVDSKNLRLPSAKTVVIEATKAPSGSSSLPVTTEIPPTAPAQIQYPNTKAPRFQPFKLASPTQPQ